MKTLTILAASVALLVAAHTCFADESIDRQPEALRGITTVTVKVTDKSKIPGMPNDAVIQSQVEQQLQSKCGLGIATKDAPAGPQYRVDLLMIPVPRGQSNATPNLALVRTSIWRPVVFTLADGVTPDTSVPPKSPLLMTSWIATTVTDPKVDPLLSATILSHINTLESSLRAVGQLPVLPRNFSEAFFLTRLPDMKKKLKALFNGALASNPLIKPAIEVELTLSGGILTYKFSGTIESTLPPVAFDVGGANPPGTLDLTALSAIGALPTAKICMKGDPKIPNSSQCATISDLFQ